MNINSKIKAFTILEVTVTMIVAAISIGIAYTAFTIMNRSYSTFDKKNKIVAEVLLADKLLKKDFIDSKHIIRSENGVLMQFENKTVEYVIQNQVFFRKQNEVRVDTFHLKPEEIQIWFENRPVEVGELVDKLQLKATVEGKDIDFYYSKRYSAVDLMDE